MSWSSNNNKRYSISGAWEEEAHPNAVPGFSPYSLGAAHQKKGLSQQQDSAVWQTEESSPAYSTCNKQDIGYSSVFGCGFCTELMSTQTYREDRSFCQVCHWYQWHCDIYPRCAFAFVFSVTLYRLCFRLLVQPNPPQATQVTQPLTTNTENNIREGYCFSWWVPTAALFSPAKKMTLLICQVSESH